MRDTLYKTLAAVHVRALVQTVVHQIVRQAADTVATAVAPAHPNRAAAPIAVIHVPVVVTPAAVAVAAADAAAVVPVVATVLPQADAAVARKHVCSIAAPVAISSATHPARNRVCSPKHVARRPDVTTAVCTDVITTAIIVVPVRAQAIAIPAARAIVRALPVKLWPRSKRTTAAGRKVRPKVSRSSLPRTANWRANTATWSART